MQIQNQGSDTPEPVADLYGPNGSDFAARHLIKLLADMVPARTVPMGREGIASLNRTDEIAELRNFDLTSSAFQNGWPAERLVNDQKRNRWLHGDTREVAYLYNNPLFFKWVMLGNLSSP